MAFIAQFLYIKKYLMKTIFRFAIEFPDEFLSPLFMKTISMP